jgi:pyruvate formate lyase activating enzyme
LLYQSERCNGCQLCVEICPQNALSIGLSGERDVAVLNRSLCDNCGKCVEVCYPGAIKLAGTAVNVGDLVSQVEKDLPFFRSSGGGVTLSGGEPARQFKFSYNFLLGCQERGIHTALQTTGYARWDVISALASVTDLLLYDVKFIDEDSHCRYTGVTNKLILDNLRKLAERNHEIHVRVPCIPGVNDSPQQIRAVAQFVEEIGIQRIVLLPYNGAAGAKYEWIGLAFELEGKETQSDEYMNRLANMCRQEGLVVQIGG